MVELVFQNFICFMVSKNDIRNSGIFDFEVFPIEENIASLGSGNNQKNILVGLSDKNTPELAGFLEKVIASVGVDLDKDAFTVFLTEGQQFSVTSLSQQMDFDKAVFFGIKPSTAGLNLNVELYHPMKFANYTFLFTGALSEIQNKPALKRPLWEGLKGVFGN